MKTGLFAVFDSQKSKDQTAGPVFSSLGPVWLQSFCSLETGLPNTSTGSVMKLCEFYIIIYDLTLEQGLIKDH